MVPKVQRGIGSGNQSDDEMAFMSFYSLIKYTKEPPLRTAYLTAFHQYWMLEQPERNPLFHFAYAAVAREFAEEGPSLTGTPTPGDSIREGVANSWAAAPSTFCRFTWDSTTACSLWKIPTPNDRSVDAIAWTPLRGRQFAIGHDLFAGKSRGVAMSSPTKTLDLRMDYRASRRG
jgi:hypothetical protein